MNTPSARLMGLAAMLALAGLFAERVLAEKSPAVPVAGEAAVEQNVAAEPAADLEAAAPAPDAPAAAASGGLSVGFYVGDNVEEYFADALVPLHRSGQSALFLDLRGSFLEDREQEFNAGFVLRRRLADRDAILGLNVFYDTRWTELDNEFDQVGAGVELLTKHVDVRANYYHPLNDQELVSRYTETASGSRVEGGRRITSDLNSTYELYEEALDGFDAEVGVWLPFMARTAPTALYVGYYSFSSDHQDDIDGLKARIEVRVHPNVTLDAMWFEDDDLNRTEYFVGARVQVPLDFWRGFGFRRAQETGSRVRPFDARMDEPVNRDFRIRTIVTDPVLADQQDNITSSRAINAPRETASKPPPPPPPPPNCYLNENGDVICE